MFDKTDPPSSPQGGGLNSSVGWAHLISDMTIFFAYTVIAGMMMIFLYRQRQIPFRGLFWLLWLFMLTCGLTRLTGATMYYYPAYRLLVVIKVATAGIAAATVIALVRLIPMTFGLPVIADQQRKAKEELEKHKHLEEKFLAMRDHLEQRATQLTVRDRKVRKALHAASASTVSWEVHTNNIVWEMGLHEIFAGTETDSPLLQAWSQILDDRSCDLLQKTARAAAVSSSPMMIELPLASTNAASGAEQRVIRIRAAPDKTIPGQPLTMTGCAGILLASAASMLRGPVPSGDLTTEQ